MDTEFLKFAADKWEADDAEAKARALEDHKNENYGSPVYEAADALAKALELLKVDPSYAEVLGISKRGMDYINGAEATLRAASIGM